MAKQTDFAYHLTTYLGSYLSGQRNFSTDTVRSYRDTFKLLLKYFREDLGIPTGKVEIQTLTKVRIQGFLTWLKEKRRNGDSTVRIRLAALHAFFAYVQDNEPRHILLCQQILSLKLGKVPKAMVGFLTIKELQLIFAEGNESSREGRRDLAILHLLYDSGARVQEICDLCVRDVYLGDNPHVMLTGKGNKTRYVPIVTDVAKRLAGYMAEEGLTQKKSPDKPLFVNKQRRKMTRGGYAYIVSKYAKAARLKSLIIPSKITPHIFRHTKAMHLCQAGIDIVYIRDLLGHVDLATTEIYAKLNIELTRDALEDAYPELPSRDLPDWTEQDGLMKMLNSY